MVRCVLCAVCCLSCVVLFCLMCVAALCFGVLVRVVVRYGCLLLFVVWCLVLFGGVWCSVFGVWCSVCFVCCLLLVFDVCC